MDEMQRRLVEQVEQLSEDRVVRNARIRQLETALEEALDFAAEGWAYATDYFREKWDAEARHKDLLSVLNDASPLSRP